jgi:hypothetical protein
MHSIIFSQPNLDFIIYEPSTLCEASAVAVHRMGMWACAWVNREIVTPHTPALPSCRDSMSILFPRVRSVANARKGLSR